MQKYLRLMFATSLIVLLSACGGGGGGGGGATPPAGLDPAVWDQGKWGEVEWQ